MSTIEISKILHRPLPNPKPFQIKESKESVWQLEITNCELKILRRETVSALCFYRTRCCDAFKCLEKWEDNTSMRKSRRATEDSGLVVNPQDFFDCLLSLLICCLFIMPFVSLFFVFVVCSIFPHQNLRIHRFEFRKHGSTKRKTRNYKIWVFLLDTKEYSRYH